MRDAITEKRRKSNKEKHFRIMNIPHKHGSKSALKWIITLESLKLNKKHYRSIIKL